MPVPATAAFAPKSRQGLIDAVRECIRLSPVGDCSAHGPIGSWDVSAVTDMHGIFYRASDFNQDLSKWDVSAVIDMYGIFYRASDFNHDISK